MRRLIWLFVFIGSIAQAAAPADLIEKAIELIETERFDLARVYLDPVVIDPRLSAAQRSRAYYYRGFAFFADGLMVSALQDYNRSLEFDAANSAVQAAIGQMYARGLGVKQNDDLAFQLFLKAARGDHGPSKSYVGFALLTGRGIDRDVDKARFWLNEAAEAGDDNALLQLARSYRAPFADEPEPEVAAVLYRDAIMKGSVEAQVALGYMQLSGELGEVDTDAALERFRAAAAKGSAAAQAALGYAHMTGNGVSRDYAVSRQWYDASADQDYPAAFLGLGHLYENGLGVTADPKRARQLYQRAATLGDVGAQLRAAALELAAGNTLENTRAALYWFLAAAQRGSPEGFNGAAWVMATSHHDELRDGERAIIQAERAVELATSAMTLDTLAAAYAESGQFERALELQNDAIAAIPDDSEDLADELQEHLEAYRNNEPWRE